jgi:hypothetical protein
MTWFIDDLDEYQIYISNGVQEYTVPKFRIFMEVEEPLLYLYYSDSERGDNGERHLLTINYLDVADGYSGYVDNPGSAQDLADDIQAMITSGFSGSTPGGDLLTAKAQLLGHDGISDVIITGGPNEYLLVRDNAAASGYNFIPKTDIYTSTMAVTAIAASTYGKKVFTIGTVAHNPADATTYYWGGPAWNPVTGAIQDRRKTYLYEAATITHCYIEMLGTTSGATAENISIYIQVNGTTDYLVQTTAFGVGAWVCSFANTGLNIALGATDWFVFKIVCPTWVVNPTQVYYSGKILYSV